MNLVDAVVLGGAGVDLEDLPAERIGLGRDTAAEALLGEAVCFAVGRSFKDNAGRSGEDARPASTEEFSGFDVGCPWVGAVWETDRDIHGDDLGVGEVDEEFGKGGGELGPCKVAILQRDGDPTFGAAVDSSYLSHMATVVESGARY
jgi:hypothetical protein